MKHSLKITLVLLLIFFLAQVVGLIITAKYIDIPASRETGKVAWQALPLQLERPQIEESKSYPYLFGAMLIGTLLAFLLMRLKAFRFWKLWFLLAVTLCLTIAFGAFLPHMLAFAIALPLALWKIFRPNILVHNLTELFLYGGIAAIFVPILNLFSASILLILISLYDMYAVWKSKHMVKLAEFQTKQKVFAGLFIPYQKTVSSAIPAMKQKKSGEPSIPVGRNAVLGGGDIGFPLMFTGVMLKNLLFTHSFAAALGYSLIVSSFATVVLGILLFKAQEGKFYPAMPFVTVGCFVGIGVLKLIL